ncbi:hypothetical protein CEXT_426171 [Caerostris extrusa]|uniref:Uncharacterized protein n=1 Tax=Caerostris extrusa TaxID=172846 RepID=A0AAV4RST3_CAEEX|nr:hypothetical protein CEXT_426171 [Caerostris extrusa]
MAALIGELINSQKTGAVKSRFRSRRVDWRLKKKAKAERSLACGEADYGRCNVLKNGETDAVRHLRISTTSSHMIMIPAVGENCFLALAATRASN